MGGQPVRQAGRAIGGKKRLVIVFAKVRNINVLTIGQNNAGVFVVGRAEAKEFHTGKLENKKGE